MREGLKFFGNYSAEIGIIALSKIVTKDESLIN